MVSVNNSRIVWIKNTKFSGYYFYINTDIYRDFQICISVPVITVKVKYVVASSLLQTLSMCFLDVYMPLLSQAFVQRCSTEKLSWKFWKISRKTPWLGLPQSGKVREKRFFFSLVRESQGVSGNSVKSQGRIPKSQRNFQNSSNYWYTVRIQGSHFA